MTNAPMLPWIKTRPTSRLGALVGASLCLCLWADAQAMGVMQAYEAARQHDARFRAAIAERDAGAEYKNLGRAQMRPTLTASYTTSENRAHLTNPSGTSEDRNYRSLSSGVQLQQPLVNFDAMAARRQGMVRSAASDARFVAQEQDLIIRLFEAYSTSLYAQEQLDQAQAQLAALAGQQRANEQLLAKGEGTRTDLLETIAQHDMALAQSIEAQDNLNNAQTRLQAMTGLDPSTLDRLRPGFSPVEIPSYSLEQWQSLARERNPLLQALRMDVEAALEDTRRAQSGHLPRLDLLASTGRSESDSLNSYRQSARTSSVGIQLSVPLYAGGAVSAQARQAVARHAQAQAELEARTGEIMTEVHKQFRLVSSSSLRLQAAGRAVESAQILVEATRKSVAGGVRTNMDVLDARERLARAERDLGYNRYLHLLAVLRLQAAAGVLSSESLQTVASRFAPHTAR
jgi:outer membrane protein, protease secretion system